MSEAVLVSACLLGLKTRYNDCAKDNRQVAKYLRQTGAIAIPVCPEQLAGLPTPRPPADFAEGDGAAVLEHRGRVVNPSGTDLSAAFRRGAEETLKIARLAGCRTAIMKERSPSCGVGQIYRQGQLVAGSGVTAALLERHGLRILSEADVCESPEPDPLPRR